ncbi:MAG TPA: YCF48-related protein [Fibrobacteria bacterium]|nr:YCF48-related protein [Fibrobacteria bacterium]
MGIRAVACLFPLLASCLFETKEIDPRRPGYLNLDLVLRPNSGTLFKTASADTLFRLDSVIIVLSATGAATITNRYAISGRADSGNIVVSPKIFALAPLRIWKAKILSVDTTLNPSRKDTVHIDSVSFGINPGDTAYVTKTVNPVFSILRARLVSNSAASLANNVKYLRIRVDGTVRDSTPMGPNLRFVDFGNGTTGCAVGDSGVILRTTNSGANWAAATSNTTRNLHGVNFPGANTGWAVGAGGTVLSTSTGTSWFSVSSGTAQDLNATYFNSNNTGWAVGEAGTIIKTTNGASFSTLASGTVQELNGVYFTNSSTGTAVGNAGTILRTTDGGSNWSAQTSGTTENLKGVFFPSSTLGFAVGNGGVILKTTNGGSAWTPLASGTTADLSVVFFTSTTAGYIAGEGGVLLTTSDATTWTASASGTVQNLNGFAWTTNENTAVAVGNLGSVARSTNGTAYTHQLIGTKLFDVHLTYKYFTPNVSHTLVMDAIDTLSGPLRGYQATKAVLLAPGKDTTVTPNSSLAKCGYSGTSACTP